VRRSTVEITAGCSDLHKNWNLSKLPIGAGAYGKVFTATNVHDETIKIAIK